MGLGGEGKHTTTATVGLQGLPGLTKLAPLHPPRHGL